MSREDQKKYFDVLELKQDSSLSEIKNAYLRLKKLYSSDSMVISPIADEFPKKKRMEILKLIEEAYTELMALLNNNNRISQGGKESKASHVEPEGEIAGSIFYSGEALKQIRKNMGIQLYEVALNTKIRVEILNNIELEKFNALPPEVYLRGHLINYASYLMLDSKKVADEYIEKYREWKEIDGKKAKV